MHSIAHKIGGNVNHVLCHGSSLRIVAANEFQSTVGSEIWILNSGRNSPAKSKSVRDTGIQALTAIDRMDMSGVSGKKNPATALPCHKGGCDSFLD